MKLLLQRLGQRLPASVYLSVAEGAIKALSSLSLNHYWQEYVRRSLGTARSPMWAAEIFQITSILVATGTLLWVTKVPQLHPTLQVLIGAVAAYRLFDILVFALRWVLVDRRRVKDLRRSLLTFSLNLIEIGGFATLLIHAIPGAARKGPAATLYEMLGSIFTLSLPEDAISGEGWLP